MQQSEKLSRRQMSELIQKTGWNGVEVRSSRGIGQAGQQICVQAAEDDVDLNRDVNARDHRVQTSLSAAPPIRSEPCELSGAGRTQPRPAAARLRREGIRSQVKQSQVCRSTISCAGNTTGYSKFSRSKLSCWKSQGESGKANSCRINPWFRRPIPEERNPARAFSESLRQRRIGNCASVRAAGPRRP